MIDVTPTPLALFNDCTPEAVRRFEEINATLPQIDLGTTNVVHGGMCARTIFIPAGCALTGALTNCDNVCIFTGDITVTTDTGPQRYTGFHVLPARGGHKRAGFAHADTYWTTIWRTEKTNIVEIENEMTDEADQLQTRTLLPFERRKEIEP